MAAAVAAPAVAVPVEQILGWIWNCFRKTFDKTTSPDCVSWWNAHNTLPFLFSFPFSFFSSLFIFRFCFPIQLFSFYFLFFHPYLLSTLSFRQHSLVTTTSASHRPMVGPPPLAPTGSLRAAGQPSSAPTDRPPPRPPAVGSTAQLPRWWALVVLPGSSVSPAVRRGPLPQGQTAEKAWRSCRGSGRSGNFPLPHAGLAPVSPFSGRFYAGAVFLDAFGRAPPKTASPRALPNGPFARILIGVNLSNLRPHLSFCLFNLLLSEWT
jgi:hypothetical protein